ncbi:MAG: DUF4173 domain-containing protein [Oscillospiraceae bacterium]|nr:DUF4173 domain-containing protein [Oscillospiraceae bacterium]
MNNENNPSQSQEAAAQYSQSYDEWQQAHQNYIAWQQTYQDYNASQQTPHGYGTCQQPIPATPSGTPVGVIPAAVSLPEKKEKSPFKPDIYDFCFAVFVFILGYLCSRWVVFSWLGWGVTLFTVLYLVSTTVYLNRKGIFENTRSTWFWFTVTCLIGISYALFENAGISAIRALFLFGAAVYYVIVASGSTVMKETGNYLLLDCINGFIVIPFKNFFNQYASFSYPKKSSKQSRPLPIIMGILIALILAGVLIPMLLRADSGGFRMVVNMIEEFFTVRVVEFLIFAFFAIPIAAYMYGLISGAAHRRHTNIINRESAEKKVTAMRFTPSATVHIILCTVCGLYLVFILSQIPYFFSAFTGNRPEGWLIFSEYARHGFFELSGIATINLTILTIVNVTSKEKRIDSKMLKALNITLALITLVLIATAFSKMALYIDAYGLTMPRLLPCIFMVFLAIAFLALIALQKWNFSIVRLTLVTGAVMITLLCLSSPDALVASYNTNRFLSGTLQEYDVEVLYRAGKAGIIPALEVLNQTDDRELKEEINLYLLFQAGYKRELHTLNIESFLALQAVSERDD